jgi:hypothetical protein
MQNHMRCTGFATRSAIVALSFVLVVPARSAGLPDVVRADGSRPPESSGLLAQAGSTGGSVAKQGKSVSGDQDADQPRGPKEHKPPQPRTKAKPTASYEGTWHGVSSGRCISDYRWTVQVRDGIMSGSGAEGHVSPGGATIGTMTVVGTKYSFKGHAVGPSQVAGTWTRPDGCSGTWTTSTKSE